MAEKACRRCDRWLPAPEFPKDCTKRDGLATMCKDCRYKGNQEWRAKHREELAAKKRQHYHENREQILRSRHLSRNHARYINRLKQEVFNHYGNKCYCCDLRDPRFLTIEHLNNDGYTVKYKSGKGKRLAGTGLYRHIIDAGFPSDITLACFNCNCARAYWGRGGECPHKTPLSADVDLAALFIDRAAEGIAEGVYDFPLFLGDDIRQNPQDIELLESIEQSRRADSDWKARRSSGK